MQRSQGTITDVDARLWGLLCELADTYEATADDLDAQTTDGCSPSDDVIEHRAMARLLRSAVDTIERSSKPFGSVAA